MERLSSKDDRSQTRHVIRRNSKGTAVYRTVRTVVWEDGGKPPPTRFFGVRALCAFGAYDRRRRAICGANAANTPFGLAYGRIAHTARLFLLAIPQQL